MGKFTLLDFLMSAVLLYMLLKTDLKSLEQRWLDDYGDIENKECLGAMNHLIDYKRMEREKVEAEVLLL